MKPNDYKQFMILEVYVKVLYFTKCVLQVAQFFLWNLVDSIEYREDYSNIHELVKSRSEAHINL